MATAPENRRTDSIRVRLAPEMMERFENLASRYGMPPATLCAFAVARFVQQEETNAQLTRMAVNGTHRKSGQFFIGNSHSVINLVGECAETRTEDKGNARRKIRFRGTDDVGAVPWII